VLSSIENGDNLSTLPDLIASAIINITGIIILFSLSVEFCTKLPVDLITT